MFANMCFVGKIDKYQLAFPNWWRLDLEEFLSPRFLKKKNLRVEAKMQNWG